MYDPLAIEPLIETHAELAAAGLVDEAAELRASIVEFLDGQIDRGLAAATTGIPDNLAYTSECLLQCMLALRVYGPPIGGLPHSMARTLATTALFCQALGQDEAAGIAQAMASPDFQPFYPVTESCQVGMLDGLYQRCFGRRDHGQFVEVGAFDGESFSNTCGLADLGWRGLYIEPTPSSFERCRARHARNTGVVTLNIGIGSAPSRAFVIDEGPLTQITDQAQAGAVEVAICRLDDVLTEQRVAPGFDLLVVDVEGFEGEVFAGFDLAHWHPAAILIELSELKPLEPSKIEIRDRLVANGYRLLFQDTVNSLYVRR